MTIILTEQQQAILGDLSKYHAQSCGRKVLASALVLARRALQPADEWERVDPVAIGLADYQQDLNEERLREAMLEVLGLFQLDRASGAFVPATPRPSARASAPACSPVPSAK